MLTAEQFEARKRGIGGSDAAAICGFSKWKTAYDVYVDKAEQGSSMKENDFLRFGSLLESFVADEYSRRTGLELEASDITYFHNDHEWMLANIDRLVKGKRKLLECKVSFFNKDFGDEGSDQMPDEYLFQCAHYAAVLDMDEVDLAVMAPFGKELFRIYTYKRNKKFEERLISAEKRFWHENVLKKIPPAPSNNQEASLIWSVDDGDTLLANDETKQKIEELKKVKSQIKTLSDVKDGIELFVKSQLKLSSIMRDEYGNELLSWKRQVANRFDTTKFKEEHPDLYGEYLKESSTRVLRLKGGLNEHAS